MSGPPAKHSLTLRGHRTSVSLEPEFCAALRDLAAERGSYSTFKGSKWDRGIMPADTIDML